MPLLKNMRHEQMAQEIAAGKTQVDAYVAAGFKSKDPIKEASRYLKRNPQIEQRVLELRRDADARKQHEIAIAAEHSGTSKGYVMQRLHELVERCMQHYPVLDAKGNQVYVETPEIDEKGVVTGTKKLAPAYTFDAKGAARGLHLLGLEHGMFAQRLKVERSPFDGLPANVLKTIYDYLATTRGRVIDHNAGSAAFLPAAITTGTRVDSGSSS